MHIAKKCFFINEKLENFLKLALPGYPKVETRFLALTSLPSWDSPSSVSRVPLERDS